MTRERVVSTRHIRAGGLYFASPNENYEFISTGCKILDLALGGGWAEGHIANIVGDKSTGKTLLCIEACANFARKYPRGRVLYRECESVFEHNYAASLGMPMRQVDFGEKQLATIEDFESDILKVLNKPAREPVLYIVDSLDALSDEAELKRKPGQGSFGTAKAKKLTEFLRKHNQKISRAKVTLIFVSQVRDIIDRFVMGKKITRAAAHALDHHAAQIVWLYYTGKLKREVDGIERVVGIDIKAACEKNKVGAPWRTVRFPIVFGYGIDDDKASRLWMKQNKGKWPATPKEVEARWWQIERSFLPEKPKYATASD